MEVLNSIYPDIKFTVEEEIRGSIAFLDVLVQRSRDGALNTKVYRKPTHTDRILHYHSNHPAPHKASCIRTLFKRVHSHCSTVESKAEERRHLVQVCRMNGYPPRFIKRHSMVPEPRNRQQDEEPSTRATRVSLPYISNVSKATARLLAPHNIQVAHKPNQTLRAKVMCPKDQLPATERSTVVYKIDCMDCQGNYVGETSKRLKTRLHEHKLAIKRGEQHSQIWAHMAEHNHRFDFENTQILANDATKGGRLLKEAWYSGADSINRHVDLCPAHQALRMWSACGRTNAQRRPHHEPHSRDKDATWSLPLPHHTSRPSVDTPPTLSNQLLSNQQQTDPSGQMLHGSPRPIESKSPPERGGITWSNKVGLERWKNGWDMVQSEKDDENEPPPNEFVRHAMVTRARSNEERHPPPMCPVRSRVTRRQLRSRQRSLERGDDQELRTNEGGARRQQNERRSALNGAVVKNALGMCEERGMGIDCGSPSMMYVKGERRKNGMGWREGSVTRPRGRSGQDRGGLEIQGAMGGDLDAPPPSPLGGDRMRGDGGVAYGGGRGRTLTPNPRSSEVADRAMCEGIQIRNKKGMCIKGGAPELYSEQLGPMTRSRSRKQALNNGI